MYMFLMGVLVYFTITHPNLSYMLKLENQFMQNPRKIHLDCVKRILKHVKSMVDFEVNDALMQLG